jgi:hypothetical protein
MADETAGDNSSEDWRLLSDEYFLIIEKKTKSGPLAEERLRDYFAEGPVDPDGRDRYRVRRTVARLGRGRPIYTPRDRLFWYSEPEFRIDCKIDAPNSSVHWSGPTVVQDSEHDVLVLVPDYNRMAEYQLIEIRLRHDVVAEFMGLPAEPRAVLAGSTVPDPPAKEPGPAANKKIMEPKEWLHAMYIADPRHLDDPKQLHEKMATAAAAKTVARVWNWGTFQRRVRVYKQQVSRSKNKL